MASAKEHHVRAVLMRDPAFRETWKNVLAVCRQIDFEQLDDPDLIVAEIRQAMDRAKIAIYARPELAALVEATETEGH